MMKRSIQVPKFVSTTVVALALAASAWSQAPAPAGKQEAASPKSNPGASQEPNQQEPNNDVGQKNPAEAHVSPEEAAELFKSVDEIMQFASKDTGLSIKTPVKRELASRETVEKYISERMADDEDEKRFERTELVLKKFGLLPREFDLRPFMIKLLRDQVAGFYDSKRKTVYLLDWIPPEMQRPVLAHELTHALQDQTIDLEKSLNDLRQQVKASLDADNAEGEIDEEISARTALFEGQGMAVLIDYLLNPVGRSMQDSPQFVEAMKVGMSSSEGSPMLTSAPMLLRESLVFPYRDGLGFVQALLQQGGKKRAYSGALVQPPHDTHQILMPKSYLENAEVPLLLLPNLKPAMAERYERYDSGSVGQFDIVLLMKQFADNAASRELSPDWRGGIYYAARKSGKPASATPDLALAYLSKWSSPAAGGKFADIYERALKQRYTNVSAKKGYWETNEGAVFIESLGDYVLVMESFDEKTAASIRKIMLDTMHGKQSGGKPIAQSNLSMRVVSPIFATRLLMGW